MRAPRGQVLNLLALLVQSTNADAEERGLEEKYSVYLLYWYKRTNTDAEERGLQEEEYYGGANIKARYAVYLLYWYKRYKY